MPLRKQLLKLLELYCPHDAEQQRATKEIESFVKNHSDCFLRTNVKGHITASSWLVSPDNSSVLLTHHKKIGRWIQLGGHADGDSDVLRVARREAREESGIEAIVPVDSMIFDVDIHDIFEHQGVSTHKHYDIRFAFLAADTCYRVSEESHDLAWVSIKDLLHHKDSPSLARMARKWLEKAQIN